MINSILRFVRVFEKRFKFLRDIPPSGKILDCGCGDFISSAKLIASRPDIDWHAVDVFDAGTIPSDVKFSIVNLEEDNLPFTDETFDAIIVLHVMEHIERLEHFCSELRRVLKKSGVIYIEVPGILTLFAPTSARFFAKTGNFFDDITHKRIFTKPSLAGLTELYLKMETVAVGTARNPLKIIALPVTLLYSIFKWRAYFMTSIGDLLGYRLYLIAKKQS